MRKRTYTLAVLTLLTAATIAIGWATQSGPLLGSERTEQTTAGSAGERSKTAGRESAFTGSEGDEADVARVSSIIAAPLGERAKKAGRESS